MGLDYLSVCSGIEAASVAWHPLNWRPVAFSEIEPFPCKVLKHHYPHVPNWGDMSKYKEWPNANINALVGGTPCQSFSIAGLRKGLDDPRGNLMLTYLAIADRYKPEWIVWENVPGVLSSNGGRDFGTFLQGLAQLGYGFAYRVLDAQFCRTHEHPGAVPQRRRRVFVVGYLGDWRSASAVLFDSESLRGNPPPSRKAGKEVDGTIGARTGCSVGVQDATSGHMIASIVSPTVSQSAPFSKTGNSRVECEAMITCMAHGQSGAEITNVSKKWPAEVGSTLNAHYGDKQGLENQHINEGAPLFVIGRSPTLNCNHEQPIIALAGNTIGRKPENGGNGKGYDESGCSYTLTKTDVHAVTYGINGAGHCLRSGASKADKPSSRTYVESNMRVRRLTPLEAERLQGFPDGYTDIPGASNTTRYKALGNSMAVPCMRIIGERIAMVNDFNKQRAG